ncbi:MAG: hypothetical protein U9N59_04265 [Campylobacterota bacterium]|nr:hypothetical protein [Campylobacterota bacterium]
MKLTLHIGHGKTGTSAIQSLLALNTDLLEEYDICYPKNETFASAKKGYVTSGNLNGPGKYNKSIYEKTKDKVKNHYLFSNESIMSQILADFATLKQLEKDFDLELILYCRNPLDHAFSSYGQGVKRGGYTMSISDWIDSYNTPQRVVDMIKLCNESSVSLQLINYSKIDSIEKSFCDVLLGNKSVEFLAKAKFATVKTVNRSLSRVEYEIQREFNKYIGAKSSKFISDRLVNNAAKIKSEKEYISINSLEKFNKKHQKNIDQINKYLDKDKQLTLEIPQDLKPQTDTYEISSKQIAVLVESISEQILNNELLDKDADYLRDISLKFDNKKPLTLKDAHYLMRLAHKARPEGPVIKQKLEIYKKELKI